jgi:hypothetical protein
MKPRFEAASITLMSGFDVTCNGERLAAIRAEAGPSIRRMGFIKLRCDPDGPDLLLLR